MFARIRPSRLVKISGVRYASRLRPQSRSSRPPLPSAANRSTRVPPSSGRQDAIESGSSQTRGLDGLDQSQQAPPRTPEPTSLSSISESLRAADPSTNSLLAPVHIPSSSSSVLKDTHPATSILANSGLVVHRQIEMLNVFMGFEQANRYVILDAQGDHIGYMAEHDGGLGSAMKRQLMRTHRGFVTNIFDRGGTEVLRFNRPFSWINSRIGVYDPVETKHYSDSSRAQTTSTSLVTDSDPMNPRISTLPLSEMRVIGEAQQEWAPLRRKYNLFLFNTEVQEQGTRNGGFNQFARVDEPFLSWDFSLLNAQKQLIGSVNRNFVGFAREIFTDTGVYALRMDSAGLTEEAQNKHLISRSGKSTDISTDIPAMSLDQRAVMLATAVSIDFDYFSRHSGSGGMVPIPLWMPWFGGEAAGAGAVGAEAAGVAGAAESTGAVVGGEAIGPGVAGTLARSAGGAVGAGDGAIAGAGTMAGYEIMQRGRGGEAKDVPSEGAQPDTSGNWWEQGNDHDDPWNQGGRGGGGEGGGEGGGGGGGGGDGGSWLDEFF